jgi:phosphoribosylaminoimidazolecarboxamide formyltransferase/IMP cyclohydrolase
MKQTALFSLNDTSYAELFAEQLIQLGWDIVASSETVDLLRKKDLPVLDIADFTATKENYGFPPTLHAKVEYALTTQSHPRIDIVYVIPYPLSEGNDIGGRTLLALAVKGGRIAVMNTGDMKRVVTDLSETGEVSHDLRLELADKACFEIANHYFSLINDRKQYDFLSMQFSYNLLSGENPYQVPASAFVSENNEDPSSLFNFKQVSGDEPCFTNMADVDCILQTLCLAAEAFLINTGSVPYLCVAAKHGNACGMGVSRISSVDAAEKALGGNPVAIWGGEVITNFPIDEQLSAVLFKSTQRERLLGDSSWMLDVVIAPSFTPEAISVLGRRSGRKLMENNALISPSLIKSKFSYRPVRGGFMRQPPASYILNLKECKIAGHGFSENEVASLIIAWSVAFSSSIGGNEVAFAKDGALLSAGGGPSTVEAVKVAVMRAIDCGHDTKDSAFAADAFFPFTDAPSVLCAAGISVGCVPAGGRHMNDVRDYFRERGATIAYIPEEFRGFCRH